MTSDMESLQNAIFFDQVPDSWNKRAYPSMTGLANWFVDLLSRIKELETWTSDFALPSAVWLAGFFNPQSFLTAIMQSMARKNEWPLDKMCLQCDVTKKTREDCNSPPREGAYVHGLFMEGARWDSQVRNNLSLLFQLSFLTITVFLNGYVTNPALFGSLDPVQFLVLGF